MRSLNKRNNSHPEKKKAMPAVKKGSRKTGASSAAAKKPVVTKVVGKGKTQPGKKEALKTKEKSSKKPVLPAAAKKQPAKAKPAGKTAQPVKKKEAPKVTAKPVKKPAPPAAAKKQPIKTKPAGKTALPVKKIEAPKVTAKPAKNPAPPAAATKQPVKAKPTEKAAQPGKKQEALVAGEKILETKLISLETHQPPEGKKIAVFNKVQTKNVMVSPVELGKRYKCYRCGIKFYDLGRPQPLCPSCGANQQDGVIKAARKRRGKHRSAYAAKTEPLTVAPGENEDLHEVVDELDAEFVLDVDDIVLDEHQDSEDKE